MASGGKIPKTVCDHLVKPVRSELRCDGDIMKAIWRAKYVDAIRLQHPSHFPQVTRRIGYVLDDVVRDARIKSTIPNWISIPAQYMRGVESIIRVDLGIDVNAGQRSQRTQKA